MLSKKLTVLAIDDDPDWLDFLEIALGEAYSLVKAVSADEAVDLVGRIQPSLIILDVMMHGHKDGFTAFSELQRDPACKDIPVIMFSEVNKVTKLDFSSDGMEEYLGARPALFLEKPVSAERLVEAVESAIANAQECGRDAKGLN